MVDRGHPEFHGVSKSFGDRVLIENLSFKVPAGAIVGIIGPNGAGKSTLFRMITGQEKPDGGTIDALRAARAEELRTACSVHPGEPAGAPLHTSSTTTTRRAAAVPPTCSATASTHPCSNRLASDRRRCRTACPTSESGPSSTRTAGAAPATSARVVRGSPRSPAAWVWETSRHSAAHPTPFPCPAARPAASTRTRQWLSSTQEPPRTGCCRRPALRAAGASWATARSTPTTGTIPASTQARVKRTAP